MTSNTNGVEMEYTRKRLNASNQALPTDIIISEPDGDDISGVESFDEDDIYDGSENSDDIICCALDLVNLSASDGMVCLSLPSTSSSVSHIASGQ